MSNGYTSVRDRDCLVGLRIPDLIGNGGYRNIGRVWFVGHGADEPKHGVGTVELVCYGIGLADSADVLVCYQVSDTLYFDITA
jgi:hypothetical protein